MDRFSGWLIAYCSEAVESLTPSPGAGEMVRNRIVLSIVYSIFLTLSLKRVSQKGRLRRQPW
jgi:hypothetical protein